MSKAVGIGSIVVLAHEARYAARPGNRWRPGKIVSRSNRLPGCVNVLWKNNKNPSSINEDYLAPANPGLVREYEAFELSRDTTNGGEG